MLAPVLGAEEALVGEVEDARVAAREDERQRPDRAVEIRIREGRIERVRLVRAQVEPLDAAPEDDVGILRIGSDVVALAAGRGLAEVRHVDAVEEAVRLGTRGGARVLLRAVDRVGEAAVGDHVVELAGRLVVPGAPGLAAVQRHDRALVDAEDLARRVGGVDPQLVVVVAAGSPLDGHEGPAAVVRAVEVDVARVDDVGVLAGPR